MKKRSRRGNRLMQSLGASAIHQRGNLKLSPLWPYRNRMITAHWFGFIRGAFDRSIVFNNGKFNN